MKSRISRIIIKFNINIYKDIPINQLRNVEFNDIEEGSELSDEP